MTPPAEGPELRAVADRIDALLGELGELADPRARARAEELLELLLRFYGAGLTRMLEIADATSAGGELFARFAADDLVATLLLVHGLHPVDVETRVRRALGGVEANVELLEVRDGVARLRLVGRSNGSGSPAAVRRAVERALEEAAPDVTGIELDGGEGAGTAAPPALVRLRRAPASGAAPAPAT